MGGRLAVAAVTGRRIGVAVVDDDADFAASLADLLSLDPELVVVGTAGTVERGLSLLADGRVRLAFVDVHMPDGSGLRVVDEIRSWADPPDVALISANPPPREALRPGVEFINKQDLGPEVVRRVVRRVSQR